MVMGTPETERLNGRWTRLRDRCVSSGGRNAARLLLSFDAGVELLKDVAALAPQPVGDGGASDWGFPRMHAGDVLGDGLIERAGREHHVAQLGAPFGLEDVEHLLGRDLGMRARAED